MPEDIIREDAHVLAQKLADGCVRVGLNASVLSPTRVWIGAHGAGERFAETITCKPNKEEVLAWWWSWGDPICSVDDIDAAVTMIARVVTPPVVETQ